MLITSVTNCGKMFTVFGKKKNAKQTGKRIPSNPPEFLSSSWEGVSAAWSPWPGGSCWTSCCLPTRRRRCRDQNLASLFRIPESGTREECCRNPRRSWTWGSRTSRRVRGKIGRIWTVSRPRHHAWGAQAWSLPRWIRSCLLPGWRWERRTCSRRDSNGKLGQLLLQMSRWQRPAIDHSDISKRHGFFFSHRTSSLQ